MIDMKMKELIAVGASVSANCHPCIKFHLQKAKRLGIQAENITAALQVGVMVRGGAAGQMDELLCEMSKEYELGYKAQCDTKPCE